MQTQFLSLKFVYFSRISFGFYPMHIEPLKEGSHSLLLFDGKIKNLIG